MASNFTEEDFTCPVCYDIFKDPVLLRCSHSFCKVCMEKFWEVKQARECPVCRAGSLIRDPPLNLALKDLCETFLQETCQQGSSVSESAEICSLHNEKLKLICLDDQQLVCLVCRDSRKHSDHKFCPIDEAATDFKEELKTALKKRIKKVSLGWKRKMASNFTEKDFACPLCCDIFKDPVLLRCSHSFCKGCLEKCRDVKLARECPVCRRNTYLWKPPLNLALKNLCETFLQGKRQQASSNSAPLMKQQRTLRSNSKLDNTGLSSFEDRQE
ncbi:hypothetical protein Q7C36_009105 [Tachysurus vachellii]|uniref:Uncharacterized protein n=1 Tax=Tachysurus vachellii TaxID=175792 RepID=A0AA88SY23_TACVA|nr:hypothetical protein Q7C36_009105 [Tachysurus vachellii]